MVSERIKVGVVSFASALALALGGGLAIASAAPQTNHKVTICHRTNSVKNPYVRESVDVDSADGDTGNDKGKGDHSTHTGPVATSESVAQALKNNKQKWGDIIPPHDSFGGLNWTAQGQAVFNNGCNFATTGGGGGGGGTTTTTTGTVQGAQVTTTPQGAVAAGGGGGTGVSTAAAVGIGGSLLSVLSGMALSARRRM